MSTLGLKLSGQIASTGGCAAGERTGGARITDAYAYPTLVYVHLLLFVFWLGADAGVFLLGQHFRKRDIYALDQRLVLLRLLVIVDMVPRTAWALMVPVSVSVADMGGWWDLPAGVLVGTWLIGAVWLWLVWDAHLHDQTPRAARNRRWEALLRAVLCGAYLWIGAVSLLTGAPLAADWLAAKALLFGLIFAAAIMIDHRFKPVGGQIARLIAEGSSDATEQPLRATMDATRIWVWVIYALLLMTGWLGSVKPWS